ncbi:MAG: acyl-CoA dehydrogenase family protein [Desulfobacter sp.]|nr:MAG: acyl-CoA dehydrogenase family protein [Desulfobacter sp.]
MAILQSDQLEALRMEIREFAQKELAPFEQEVEASNQIPEHILARMREKGYFGLTIPKEYGGMGMGKTAFCTVEEELAKTHFAFMDIISLNNGLGSRSIVLDGSEEQKQKYLPKLASGEWISAFTLTEPNAGSDAASITTTAEKKGDVYILNGMKHFITNAPIADVFIVIAVTDPEKGPRGGISAFIVEKDFPGISIGNIHQSMGMQGSHKSEVIFKDTPVPACNLIGTEGRGLTVALKTVDEGRMGVAATSVGFATRLLDMAVDYAASKPFNDKPLARYQSIEWLLADMATELYAARTMLYKTAAKMDCKEDAQMEVAMCKLYGSEMVGRVVEKAMEIFGKDGCLFDNIVERILRDARILRIFEGTAEIHRIIIGRKLLAGQRPQ